MVERMVFAFVKTLNLAQVNALRVGFYVKKRLEWTLSVLSPPLLYLTLFWFPTLWRGRCHSGSLLGILLSKSPPQDGETSHPFMEWLLYHPHIATVYTLSSWNFKKTFKEKKMKTNKQNFIPLKSGCSWNWKSRISRPNLEPKARKLNLVLLGLFVLSLQREYILVSWENITQF